MSLGPGIFLSALVIYLTALFISTKDRWDWDKIILWPLAVTISFALLTGVGFGEYNYYQDHPKVQNSFGGLILKLQNLILNF